MIKYVRKRTNQTGFGKIVAITLALSFYTLVAQDNFPPSTVPPGGLAVSETPQFVVIGWDDNIVPDGVAWVADLFNDRTNPVGNSHPGLFDGESIGTSFYFNTNHFSAKPELVTEVKKLVDSPHLIGNHTRDHLTALFGSLGWDWNVFSDSVAKLSVAGWRTYINDGKSDIQNMIEVDESYHLNTGFRIPYLSFTKNALQAIKDEGYIYDCSVWGWTSADGKGINWPYTLDNGIPWGEHGDKIVPGLWEFPVYAIRIPTDAQSPEYGIPAGLQTRLGKETTGGMDFAMWKSDQLTAAEFLALLKHSFDIRYRGDRAPFTFGGHSPMYSTTAVESEYNATLAERRQVFVDFLDYVQSFDDVRVVTSPQLIEWMRNPVGLNDVPTSIVSEQNNRLNADKFSLSISNSSGLQLSVPTAGKYTISIFTSNGRMINKIRNKTLQQGHNVIPMGIALNQNFYLFRVSNAAGTVVLKSFSDH